jgi:hypothetical protein
VQGGDRVAGVDARDERQGKRRPQGALAVQRGFGQVQGVDAVALQKRGQRLSRQAAIAAHQAVSSLAVMV